MDVDAVGLVCKYPAVMVSPIVEEPAISGLVHFGAEQSGNLVLDELENCGRMDNHEVDVHARGGVTTRRACIGGLCQSDCGIESARRYTDDSHSVIHLDLGVDVSHIVHNITGDVILEVSVDVGVDEQDSALVGDFLAIKCSISQCLGMHCRLGLCVKKSK